MNDTVEAIVLTIAPVLIVLAALFAGVAIGRRDSVWKPMSDRRLALVIHVWMMSNGPAPEAEVFRTHLLERIRTDYEEQVSTAKGVPGAPMPKRGEFPVSDHLVTIRLKDEQLSYPATRDGAASVVAAFKSYCETGLPGSLSWSDAERDQLVVVPFNDVLRLSVRPNPL